MKSDLRYTNTEVFENFPFPNQMGELDSAGTFYDSCRTQIMLANREGLTKSYNRFHNEAETSTGIQKLRELHVEMDNAVSAAYGWTDLDLGHGFHEAKQGVRYTISEPARREVLARLLQLNHERYAEEEKQGLHERKKPKATKGKKKAEPADTGRTLFGEDDS